MNVGGEWATNSAQAMYLACHHTIRTQKLNCSQSSAKVAGTVKWNCGPDPTWPKNWGILSSPGNNPALVARFDFLGGSWARPGHRIQFQPRLKPGNPEPLLILLLNQHCFFCRGETSLLVVIDKSILGVIASKNSCYLGISAGCWDDTFQLPSGWYCWVIYISNWLLETILSSQHYLLRVENGTGISCPAGW